MLPPQVLRREADAGAAHALPFHTLAGHGVGRMHGVKGAEAGAAAHVAGQAVAQTCRIRCRVVKKAAAQKQVAGGAHGGCRAHLGHAAAVA